MKKVVVLLAIFAVMGSVLTAQTVSLWNELYTEVVESTVDLYPNSKGDQVQADPYFWGFRDRFHASINADKWGAEVRIETLLQDRKSLSADDTKDWKNVQLTLGQKKANIYVFPIKAINIAFGTDYDRSLPGSRLTDARDDFGSGAVYGPGAGSNTTSGTYVGVGRYGKAGATFSFVGVENLTIAASIPTDQWFNNETSALKSGVDLNFAINYFIAPAKVNIGAAFHGSFREEGNQKFGIYIDWKGLNDKLVLKGGFTGYSKGGYNGAFARNIDDEFAAQVDFMFAFNVGVFAVEADFDVAFGNKYQTKTVTPFNVFLGFYGRVLDKKLFWYVRAGATGYTVDIDDNNLWQLTIKPGIQYTINAHNRLDVSLKLTMRNYDKAIGDKMAIGFAIPIAWRYTF